MALRLLICVVAVASAARVNKLRERETSNAPAVPIWAAPEKADVGMCASMALYYKLATAHVSFHMEPDRSLGRNGCCAEAACRAACRCDVQALMPADAQPCFSDAMKCVKAVAEASEDGRDCLSDESCKIYCRVGDKAGMTCDGGESFVTKQTFDVDAWLLAQ
eukprot:TRINITY_DN20241_c0_g1_i2.p1 TRINITY_DN20241_c0_g1~~TRINITY_DN20241_c0_g1_i2.p1  ORF type:complete len:188 (-),score=32.92 TRINITY_DN20241_c0_g1_i2:107-595(-)